MLDTLTLPTSTQTWPDQGEWTYEDYLRLPNDGQRYEIIKGVLYVSNAPNSDHQYVAFEIAAELRHFVKQHGLGRVSIAPFEVHLSEDTRPVQPDVFFVKADRWPSQVIQFFDDPPDLVVEVLSPNTYRTDRTAKFTAYEQAGVPEYWLVNPRAKTVEVYTLARGEYALLGEFTGDDLIQSKVLAGLELVNQTLFSG